MMRRFLINIKDSRSGKIEREADSPQTIGWEFTQEEYKRFIHRSKEIGTYEEMQSTISMSCETCNSYVIPIKPFYKTIKWLWQDEELDVFASEVTSLLVDVVYLDDEGWQDYMKGSLNDIPFVYDGEGSLETDTEGNPFCFKYSECAFIFDPFCSCFGVMHGE